MAVITLTLASACLELFGSMATTCVGMATGSRSLPANDLILRIPSFLIQLFERGLSVCY